MRRTSGLVQDQHPRVFDQSPGQGNQRTLTNRQIAPLILYNGIKGKSARASRFRFSLFRSIPGCRVICKVRSLEGVPEFNVFELIEGIQI